MSCDRPLLLEQSSPGFPPELRRVPSPPDEIFVRGRLELLARTPRVAIVGTRAPTPYGESQARHFARVLGAAGVVVVSGLARGIDEAAHGGALDVGAASVAVLGSGVDRPWPAGPLAERMLREGLLLSEFAPGEGPRKHHFPLRNRLIAGLSRAVVVIEAAHASGSLITARWAVDMGKDVYALPGRVDHPMARGCHRLLREGATLVEAPEELLVELGLTPGVRSSARGESAFEGEASNALSHSILQALTGETLSLDEIIARIGAPPSETLSQLAELELSDFVARSPGGLYRLVHARPT
ncbi:MAG: DNA-protecting protein DprA [Planctomycetes bacterium]|nr:DNA-protecting protein DprA [Planctomycetota bacterium]